MKGATSVLGVKGLILLKTLVFFSYRCALLLKLDSNFDFYLQSLFLESHMSNDYFAYISSAEMLATFQFKFSLC